MLDLFDIINTWIWDWPMRKIGATSWWLPLIAAIISRHFSTVEHRRIIAFVGYSIFMEFCSSNSALKNVFNENTNSGWYHLLTPGLFFLMTRFFDDLVAESKSAWLQWGVPGLFTLFAVVNAVWIDGFSSFPSTTVGLYSATGIFLAIGYFLSLLRRSDIFYLEKEPMFWIGAGLLVYYSGNFLIWIGFSFLTYEADFFYSIYRISGILTIFLNCLFVIAILLNPSKNTDEIKPLTTKA